MDPSIYNLFTHSGGNIPCPIDHTDESTAATIAGLDLSDAVSTSPSTTNLTTFVSPSTVTTDVKSCSATSRRDVRPVHAPPHRAEDGPARKRAKVEGSPDCSLESVDYWLRFDEEEREMEARDAFSLGSRRLGEMCPKRQFTNLTRASASSEVGSQPYAGASPFGGDVDFLDDSVWDHALSDENDAFEPINLAEEMSRLDPGPAPTDVPPREGLYSTPLSWERPQPGLRVGGAMLSAGPAVLSDAERRRLLDIAMNTRRRSGGGFVSGFDLGLGSNFGGPWSTPTMSEASRPSVIESPEGQSKQPDFQRPKSHVDSDPSPREPEPSSPSPEPKSASISHQQQTQQPNPAEKRKDKDKDKDTETDKDKDKDKPKSSDRAGHNDIERKYRTNLKDKIAELRDAVPALRSMGEEVADDNDAHKAAKVSKGTILMKAAEYIRYLERKNKAIKREHQELETRLRAFEQLMAAAAKQTFLMQNYGVPLIDPRGFS